MTTDSLRQAADVVAEIAGATAVQDVIGAAAAAFTTWGFAVLALLLAVAFATAPRVTWTTAAIATVTGLLGTLVAAGAGLALKGLIAERRPCQVQPALARWVSCPSVDSLSFPSNHSVFAGGLAVLVIAVARRTGRIWIAAAAMVVALAIAATRVVLGVHYWWDVVAGLALGSAVTAVAVVVLAPRVGRILHVRPPRPHVSA